MTIDTRSNWRVYRQTNRSPETQADINSTSSSDYAVFLVLTLFAIQGIFFELITLWVTERRYVVFDILPFNLYPSDLFLLPILFLMGLFLGRRPAVEAKRRSLDFAPVLVLAIWGVVLLLSRSIFKGGQDSYLDPLDSFGLLLLIPVVLIVFRLRHKREIPYGTRQMLLLLWWAWCLFGMLNGFLQQTPNLTGDIRELFVRSLIAVPLFYVGMRLNFAWISSKLILLGVICALVFGLSGVAHLADISFSMVPVSTSVHGIIPIFLAYSLALARAVSRKELTALRRWVPPLIIAVCILVTLSKPAVGGLLICTVVTLIVARGSILRSLGRSLLLLLVTIGMAIGLLWLFNSTSAAEDVVRSAYLKQDYAIQDLSGSRFAIWQKGVDAWLESPIVGHGMGYVLSGRSISISTGAELEIAIIWPHNILVQIMMQTGVVGVILVFLVITGWISQALLDSRGLPREDRWIHQSLVATAITIVFMAFYGQFFGHVHGGFLLWACVGLEAAIVMQRRTSSTSPKLEDVNSSEKAHPQTG